MCLYVDGCAQNMVPMGGLKKNKTNTYDFYDIES